MTTRPTWPEYFQQHAALASSRATLPARGIAVIVKAHRSYITTALRPSHPRCS